MNKAELEAIAKKHLREGFPLFLEEHKIFAHTNELNTSITYRTKKEIIRSSTYFDIQFIGDTCFVNYIEIEPSKRARGNGRKLFSVIEKIARECGSKKVQLTASGSMSNGSMSNGRTKTEYMESLGYSRLKRVPKGSENWEVQKVLD